MVVFMGITKDKSTKIIVLGRPPSCTLFKTNSKRSENRPGAQKERFVFQASIFQMRTVSFREGMAVNFSLTIPLPL